MTGTDLMAWTLIYITVASLAVAIVSLIAEGDENER